MLALYYKTSKARIETLNSDVVSDVDLHYIPVVYGLLIDKHTETYVSQTTDNHHAHLNAEFLFLFI